MDRARPAPADLEILPSTRADLDSQLVALELLDKAFSRESVWPTERLIEYGCQLVTAGQFLARRRGVVVGVGLSTLADDSVLTLLGLWASEALRPCHRAFIESRPRRQGGVRVRRHRPLPADPDWFAHFEHGAVLMSGLSTAPGARRQGVGRALATARIHHAARAGLTAAFVHCIEGSGSAELYAQLGFIPIVEVLPYYRTGRGMLLMGSPLT